MQISEIITACVGGRVIGNAVATLIWSNHAPLRRQGRRERSERLAFHPMRVQSDKRLAATAGIEIRPSQSAVFEAVSFHPDTPPSAPFAPWIRRNCGSE